MITIRVDKVRYTMVFYTTPIKVDLAQYEMFCYKVCNFKKRGIKLNILIDQILGQTNKWKKPQYHSIVRL